MTEEELNQLKYPIGLFDAPGEITTQQVKEWIDELEVLPSKLIQLVQHLNEEQLETPYRPGGWTIRQTIHHIGDSHTNSYVRFKWTLTEEQPVIKAYFEDRWGNLEDSKTAPISISLKYLDALHTKWCYFLRQLSEKELKQSFIHPETNESVVLDWNIGNYVWHGEHHYMHIYNIMKKKGWLPGN